MWDLADRVSRRRQTLPPRPPLHGSRRLAPPRGHPLRAPPPLPRGLRLHPAPPQRGLRPPERPPLPPPSPGPRLRVPPPPPRPPLKPPLRLRRRASRMPQKRLRNSRRRVVPRLPPLRRFRAWPPRELKPISLTDPHRQLTDLAPAFVYPETAPRARVFRPLPRAPLAPSSLQQPKAAAAPRPSLPRPRRPGSLLRLGRRRSRLRRWAVTLTRYLSSSSPSGTWLELQRRWPSKPRAQPRPSSSGLLSPSSLFLEYPPPEPAVPQWGVSCPPPTGAHKIYPPRLVFKASRSFSPSLFLSFSSS